MELRTIARSLALPALSVTSDLDIKHGSTMQLRLSRRLQREEGTGGGAPAIPRSRCQSLFATRFALSRNSARDLPRSEKVLNRFSAKSGSLSAPLNARRKCSCWAGSRGHKVKRRGELHLGVRAAELKRLSDVGVAVDAVGRTDVVAQVFGRPSLLHGFTQIAIVEQRKRVGFAGTRF